MSKVASLEIEIAANVARLTEDFKRAKEEVGSSMHSIKSTVKESMHGVVESMEGVNKGIDKIVKSFSVMAEFAAAGVIGEKVMDLGKDFAETSETISRTAQMTGMTTTQVQELGFAAQATGANSESMTTAMRKFSTIIIQAENGSKTATAAFKNVGISQEEIKNSSPHELLMRVADAYSKSADDASKSASAQALFGRSGLDLIPTLNKGSQGIEELGNKAQQLGIVLDQSAIEKGEEAADKFKELSAASKGIGLQLGSSLIPAMTAVASAFIDSATNGGILQSAMSGLNSIIIFGTKVVVEMSNELHMFGNDIAAVAATIAHPTQAKSIWRAWSDDVDALQRKQDAFFASLDKQKPEASAAMGESEGGKKGHIGSDDGQRVSGRKKLHHRQQHSSMSQYTQQLEDEKVYYQQTHDLRAMSAEEEQQYWQNILNTENVSAGDRLAIERKLSTLQLQEMKKTAGERQKMAEEEIASEQSAALNVIAINKQKAEAQLKTGQITKAQMLQMNEEFENQKYQVEVQAEQKRIALLRNDPTSDPAALQKQLDQLKQIQQKHLLDMQTMQTQAATKTTSIWTEAFKPIQSAFDTTIKGVIIGTTTWHQGMRKILSSVLEEFLSMGIHMVTTWVANEATKTAATTTGVAARTAAEAGGVVTALTMEAGMFLKSIGNAAASAFAGVTAFLAPMLGPAAPAGAAVVSGLVLAAGAKIASSAGGDWNIPADRLNMVHKNETILPADKAKGLDDMIKGSAAGGGGAHHIHIHALDSKSVRDMFESHGSALVTALRKQVRGFAV